MDLNHFHPDLEKLLRALQVDIGDEYRADESSDEPSMLVTVATSDGLSWAYQTGDTSYMGACYGRRYWASCTLTRDADPVSLAWSLVADLAWAVAEGAAEIEETADQWCGGSRELAADLLSEMDAAIVKR